MPTIYKNVNCQYSAEQMFAIVNDVLKYPDFIEWCHHVEVLAEGDLELEAKLFLKKGALNYNFATVNTLDYPNSMTMRLLEGPFKVFLAVWRFNSNDGGCEVDFKMDYEFSNKLLSLAVGSVFHSMADNMVALFIDRANSIYNKQ